MRADAQRNRELIVVAALEVFTECGSEASMDRVARAAGLSVGALYRHFPDRQALLEHIATDALTDLLEFGRAAAAALDSTRWEVLLRLVAHCMTLPLAMVKSLAGATGHNAGLEALIDATDTLFEDVAREAQREGSMRADVAPHAAIGVLNVAVCRPGARFDDPLVTVVLDGLKAPGGA
ncbi:TetR/AcrR family transcriptional regulator [Streptomyces sp. RKAG290]|uniref:TetR/AcrR family transcriptional regulator n=1 Tax=Streptomyces sp. RKAG290 TaxID=2888348 RepID=UPI0020335110|nr:TetR/AcrR family transcriptional regulator [Streptomyces sp. RKAG290]MCM2410626.1 TetR/AcrR family transcriptional regulator [Streptomyces sp. RKAG290]